MNICQVFFKFSCGIVTDIIKKRLPMARQKCKRCTSYRPVYARFIPENITGHMETITLLAEEIEALYLMDLLSLYQEDAASKMEVSRPTFARIIKSARHKVALALLGGKTLQLESAKGQYVVALCSENEQAPYILSHPKGKYIHLFLLNQHRIEEKITLLNPLLLENTKPAIFLKNLFIEKRVNLFITSAIGEGLRSVLSSKGIHLLLKEQITEEEILALW